MKNDQLQGHNVQRPTFRRVMRAIVLFAVFLIIVFVMLLLASIGAIWAATSDLGASLGAFAGDQGLSNTLTLALIAFGIVVVLSLGISRSRASFRRRG